MSFLNELNRVIPEVSRTYGETIYSVDPAAMELLNRQAGVVLKYMQGLPEAEQAREIATAMLMFLLVGRAHHEQGFASPIPTMDAAAEALFDSLDEDDTK